MSALNLLSTIAPVGPSVPQGSSGETASGFKTILAALADGDSLSPETQADSVIGPAGDEVEADADADAAMATGVPVAPVILPTPAPPRPADPNFDDGTMVGRPSGAALAGGPAIVSDGLSSTDIQARAATIGTPVDSSGSGTRPPSLLEGPSPGAVAEPRQSPVGDADPISPSSTAEPSPIPAGMVSSTGVRTGAAPVPAPAPTPAPITVPPQRPLAERTSRPLQDPVGTSAAAARAGDAATPAGAPPASPSASDPTTRPAEFATAQTVDAAPEVETVAPPADLAPADTAEARAQAPAAARETTLSQPSRAAIDATAQIAAQILRKLEGRSTRFEMALTPDDLGRVDVRLDIDAEGRLNARLAFDNPAAATDLRGRTDELRRQLEDAGFHLADDAFEFAERDSGSSAFDRGHDHRNGQSRAFAAASRLNAEIDVAQPPRWMALSLSPSGVDMKV